MACPVTYVTLKGEAGLQNRIRAMEGWAHTQVSEDFRAIIQPFNFGDPQNVDELAVALHAYMLLPGLSTAVHVATLNRSRT